MTLAMLGPGESARVEHILFGALRTLCGDLGIREGGAVRCRAGTGGVLVLDTDDGHVVSVARDWARFIRIATPVPGLVPGPVTVSPVVSEPVA
ncbi:MAG TPA: FeoA domain-containing protein [Longimicrobiales bacterium]|nr:FeoA domain-containing protein [Longimicrobiales bacterium]